MTAAEHTQTIHVRARLRMDIKHALDNGGIGVEVIPSLFAPLDKRSVTIVVSNCLIDPAVLSGGERRQFTVEIKCYDGIGSAENGLDEIAVRVENVMNAFLSDYQSAQNATFLGDELRLVPGTNGNHAELVLVYRLDVDSDGPTSYLNEETVESLL